MAITSKSIIRPYRHVEIRHFPEAASQAFKKGEVLIKAGAGVENRVTVAADAPTAGIVGIAAEDASGVTGNKVAVYCARPNAEFIGYIDGTDAVDFTDIGVPKALEDQVASEVWTVETDNDAADAVVPIQYLDAVTRTPLTAEGGTEALVLFRFIRAATIWGVDA
jgi:hypothetical protein